MKNRAKKSLSAIAALLLSVICAGCANTRTGSSSDTLDSPSSSSLSINDSLIDSSSEIEFGPFIQYSFNVQSCGEFLNMYTEFKKQNHITAIVFDLDNNPLFTSTIYGFSSTPFNVHQQEEGNIYNYPFQNGVFSYLFYGLYSVNDASETKYSFIVDCVNILYSDINLQAENMTLSYTGKDEQTNSHLYVMQHDNIDVMQIVIKFFDALDNTQQEEIANTIIDALKQNVIVLNATSDQQ